MRLAWRAPASLRFLRRRLFLPHKHAQAGCLHFQPGGFLHAHDEGDVLLDGPVVYAGPAGQLVHARVLIEDELKQLQHKVVIHSSGHELFWARRRTACASG